MKKLSDQELYQFCEQFAIILHSGIPAIEGLRIMKEDTQGKKSREILGKMEMDMAETGSLGKAMEMSGIFPDTMISYINVGEETGYLDEVMESLSIQYLQEYQISQQIKSSVTYPLLMLGMMVVVVVILLVKVLPVFDQVFRQMGMEMSGAAGRLLTAGNTLSRYSVVFIVIAAVLVVLILLLIFTKKGRALGSKAVSSLPGFRHIPIIRDYARLTQGISMGIRSGLTMDRSTELAEALVSHPTIKARLGKAREMLNNGERISDALTGSGLFHGMDARLLSVSIDAGAVDDALEKLSGRYQEEALDRISKTVSLLEPTIVIIISVLIGLVLLAVMMPLLGIFSEMIV